MAKIVGAEGSQIVQAAAGVPVQPAAIGILAASTILGGWLVGSALGSAQQGNIFFVESSGREPTDFEEWVSFLGATGGMVLTARMAEETIKEYGVANVAMYSAGLLSFVLVVRKLRGL